MDEPVKTTTESAEQPQPRPLIFWLRRFGVAGFLFYLIKGLLWILISVLVAKGCL
jgi:hypothetical protein